MADTQRVYIWSMKDVDPEDLIALLSDQERQRAGEISLPQRKKEFICGRALCRSVFRTELKVSLPNAIPTNKHGKPVLPSHISFNMSHSSGYVGIAIDMRNEVGFDIEKKNEKRAMSKVMSRYTHPDEISFLKDLSSEAKNNAFYKLWCLKESFGKALGRGLRDDLRDVCFDLRGNTVKLPLEDQECHFHYLRHKGLHLSFCSLGEYEGERPQFFEVIKSDKSLGYSLLKPGQFEEFVTIVSH